MNTYYLSPYHYEKTVQMQASHNKNPKKVDIKANESAILRAMAKYRVLNKKAITEAVNRMLPAHRQKPNFDKEVNILYDGGYLKKYHYPDAKNGRGNVVAYTLTEKGLSYVTERQMRLPYQPLTDDKRYSTATVLEYLTLNTWHLRLLLSYAEHIQSETYQLPVRVQNEKNVIIPSCIMFKNDEWSLLKQFAIAAVPYKKANNEEAVGAFLNTLLSVNAFLNNNKKIHKLSFLILLVDSFQQMEEANSLIYSYEPLQRLQVYYAIDEFINDEEPLRWIYEVDKSVDAQKAVKYNLIDLTQKAEDNKRR